MQVLRILYFTLNVRRQEKATAT